MQNFRIYIFCGFRIYTTNITEGCGFRHIAYLYRFCKRRCSDSVRSDPNNQSGEKDCFDKAIIRKEEKYENV